MAQADDKPVGHPDIPQEQAESFPHGDGVRMHKFDLERLFFVIILQCQLLVLGSLRAKTAHFLSQGYPVSVDTSGQ